MKNPLWKISRVILFYLIYYWVKNTKLNNWITENVCCLQHLGKKFDSIALQYIDEKTKILLKIQSAIKTLVIVVKKKLL